MHLWNDHAGQGQLAGFHASEGHKFIRDYAQLPGWALDKEHLHPMVIL